MFAILILLLSLAIPSCYSVCENFYIILENSPDTPFYSLIQKDTIPWSISSIHTNNETKKFDMSCVLNLNCEKAIFHQSIIKNYSEPGIDVSLPPVIPKTEHTDVIFPFDVKNNSKLTLEDTTTESRSDGTGKEITTTEATNDSNIKIKDDDNVRTNDSSQSTAGYHHNSAAESKTLASNIMAGTLGAVSAVGVIFLLKIGGQRLIEHCTQSGVYRLPA